MDASIVISIVALVISGMSLYFVIERERRDRIRFKEEQERAAQQKELGLSAIYQVGPTPTVGGHEYRYELVNTSDVPIDNPLPLAVSPRYIGRCLFEDWSASFGSRS